MYAYFDSWLKVFQWILLKSKTIVSSWEPLSKFAKTSIWDFRLSSEYASVYNSLGLGIFAKSFILVIWYGSEYASEVSPFVLMFCLWTLIWTGKCQVEIKIPLGQISTETKTTMIKEYRHNFRTSLFTNIPLDETINICSKSHLIKSNVFQILIEPVLRNFCDLLRKSHFSFLVKLFINS